MLQDWPPRIGRDFFFVDYILIRRRQARHSTLTPKVGKCSGTRPVDFKDAARMTVQLYVLLFVSRTGRRWTRGRKARVALKYGASLSLCQCVCRHGSYERYISSMAAMEPALAGSDPATVLETLNIVMLRVLQTIAGRRFSRRDRMQITFALVPRHVIHEASQSLVLCCRSCHDHSPGLV